MDLITAATVSPTLRFIAPLPRSLGVADCVHRVAHVHATHSLLVPVILLALAQGAFEVNPIPGTIISGRYPSRLKATRNVRRSVAEVHNVILGVPNAVVIEVSTRRCTRPNICFVKNGKI